MRVLSLFDGMSCGQIALNKVGIEVSEYMASEIQPQSIQITQKNYPETRQIGDVTKLSVQDLDDLGEIDLLIGGSPCTNLSRTVINNIKHNQGLKGEHSSLFYDYVRVLERVKPKFFLLENVESMRNEDKDIITETLGVEPIMINSGLVSAQDRKRYYWTNIPNVTQPADKGLVLRDIVEKDVKEKYWYKQDFTYHGEDKSPVATLHVKGHDILKRVYGLHQKSATLTGVRGGFCNKECFFLYNRGENNPVWKGGTTPDRQKLYKSTEWQNVVKIIWKRDDATCQNCLTRFSHKAGQQFHIHHVKSFSKHPELRADPENLTLLCKECHLWVHSRANTDSKFIYRDI